MGFSRKKLYPLLRISIFFEVDPWISSQFFNDPPGIFHFFALTLCKFSVFPQILTYPLEFQLPSLYPSGNFHWYPQTGGFNFFLEKPNVLSMLALVNSQKWLYILHQRKRGHFKLSTYCHIFSLDPSLWSFGGLCSYVICSYIKRKLVELRKIAQECEN